MPGAGKNRSLWLPALLLACGLPLLLQAKKPQPQSQTALADSFQRKIDNFRANARTEHPDPTPVTVTEEEVNAYFAERRLKMPDGVKSVVFALAQDEVTGRTHVDFEEIRKGHRSLNPLLAVFDGEHDCVVVAHAQPAGAGRVHVRVESVEIDGVSVPKVALEYFVRKYVQPKYPSVSLDGDYHLPVRLESVSIQNKQGVAVQR